MIKMAAMPIYGKNFKTSTSPEPKGRWPWNLAGSIEYSSTTKVIQMMTLCWPWPVLRQGQILSLMFLYGKKVKQQIFSSPEQKAHWYAYRMGRPPSLVVRLSSTLFKHLLLRNHWADSSQISYGVSMGLENVSLFKRSWSHDQDGRHAHTW